jgi:hypothetical protein
VGTPAGLRWLFGAVLAALEIPLIVFGLGWALDWRQIRTLTQERQRRTQVVVVPTKSLARAGAAVAVFGACLLAKTALLLIAPGHVVVALDAATFLAVVVMAGLFVPLVRRTRRRKDER